MSVDGSERLVTTTNDALVAQIDRTKNSVKLTLADYWEFGDLEIGDGKNGVTKSYREWYSWYDQYKQAKTSAAVNPFILQQPADGSNLPKWPSMTFNTFTSNDNFQRPNEDVESNVVVRWANRLDVVGSDKLKFHDNAPLTYESGDTYETTMACLLTHLKEYTTRLSQRLFKDKWELELWVMPQKADQSMLHRYIPQDSKAQTALFRNS